MSKPKISSERIMEIEPYVPGAYSNAPGKKLIKLSSNENPFGCSTSVVMAVNKEMAKMHRYPEGTCKELRKKRGEVNGLDPERIICGAGSDELITLICMAFGGVGKEVIYSKHGFLMYPITANSLGAVPVVADEKDLKTDVDAILNKVTDKTRIVFIANPNNPTGSYLSEREIWKLVKGLPKDVLLVLDLAYFEYGVDIAADYANPTKIIDDFDNVIMLRTFSKAYGIPALRLGWAYASPFVIDILNRVRGPFNVSSIAQVGGVAALEDQDFVKKSVAHNTKWLAVMKEALEDMGLKTYPSAANFILVDFGTSENANAADEALRGEGITARMMGAYKLPSCIRFTIGLEDENKAVLEVLRKFLEKTN